MRGKAGMVKVTLPDGTVEWRRPGAFVKRKPAARRPRRAPSKRKAEEALAEMRRLEAEAARRADRDA